MNRLAEWLGFLVVLFDRQYAVCRQHPIWFYREWRQNMEATKEREDRIRNPAKYLDLVNAGDR